ncbi:hypothetical protein [Scopulibacillus daqui]|uniref:hypothetical protein n=1 Tax=Scopulibacillus daqui TaxID=1469162 RepID=UPI0019619892|nr:hypothetical protein [Scopulibacillus daqui]
MRPSALTPDTGEDVIIVFDYFADWLVELAALTAELAAILEELAGIVVAAVEFAEFDLVGLAWFAAAAEPAAIVVQLAGFAASQPLIELAAIAAELVEWH